MQALVFGSTEGGHLGTATDMSLIYAPHIRLLEGLHQTSSLQVVSLRLGQGFLPDPGP